MTASGAPTKGSKYMRRRAYLFSKGECKRPYPTMKASKCNKKGTGTGRRYNTPCTVPRWSEKRQKFIPPCVKNTVSYAKKKGAG